MRQALTLLIRAAIFLLVALVSSHAGAADSAQEAISSSSRIHAVNVSPSGKKLVYIIGNELRDWPEGRRLRLPSDIVGNDMPSGTTAMTWTFKWNNDEGRLILMSMKSEAVVIDIDTFRITHEFGQTHSVWWSDADICAASMVECIHKFNSKSQHSWRCNGHKHTGPKGLMITDVSSDGEAMLARVAGERIPGYLFHNLAVMHVDPKSGKTKWKRLLYDNAAGVLEYAQADLVLWNKLLSAAIVVVGNDTGGGLASPQLHVATATKVVALGDGFTWVRSQPSWVGSKALAAIEQWQEREDPATGSVTATSEYRLVLFEPWKGTTETLLEGATLRRGIDSEKAKFEGWAGDSKLLSASASRDGGVVAYVLSSMDDKTWKLIVTDVASLQESRMTAAHGGASD